MNKKLVAAALGLAFAAPVFADSSNVILFGRVHTVLDHQTTETAGVGPGGNFTQESVASRLGVKGSEDLGNGLHAIFAYEFGVNSDTGGFGAGRTAYIGLKGGWGTLTVGQLDGGTESVAPLYDQASKLGSVSNNGGPLATVGGGIVAGAAAVGASQAIERTQRTSNSFGYKTTVAGVSITARHALGGGVDNQNGNTAATNKENDTRLTEIAVDYKIGNLSFGAGYENVDAQNRTQNTLNTLARVENRIQGVVSYKFANSFTLSGLVAQSNLFRAAANREDSNLEFAFSGALPLSSNSGIFALYADAERNDLAAPEDVKQMQLAYYYDLSKRTRTYVGFNRLNREVKATRVETEQDNFTIGLRHNF